MDSAIDLINDLHLINYEKKEKEIPEPTYDTPESIDILRMSSKEIKAFAESGGLGACVSKVDKMAKNDDCLMFLAGERITILKHIKSDYYLGYCEGVVGQFNAEHVYFVELDPRVLESLNPDPSSYEEYPGEATKTDDLPPLADEHPEFYEDNEDQDEFLTPLSSRPNSSQTGPRPLSYSNDHGRSSQRLSLQRPSYQTRTSVESTRSSVSQTPSIILSEHGDDQRLSNPPRIVVRQNVITDPPKPDRTSLPAHDRNSSSSDPLVPYGHSDFSTRQIPKQGDSLSPKQHPVDYFDTSDLNESYSEDSDSDHEGRSSISQDSTGRWGSGISLENVDAEIAKINRRPLQFDKKKNKSNGSFTSTGRTESTMSHDDEEEAGYSSGDSNNEMKEWRKSGSTKKAGTNMNVDEYGFMLEPGNTRRSFNIEADKTVKSYREREVKWLHIMNSKMVPSAAKKDEKVKKLVRAGIPASLRARAWQFLSESYQYYKKGVFQELASRERLPIYDAIEMDLHRCYPEHIMFSEENGSGQVDLSNVLKAFAHYNPEIGYCQGMGRLVGCMLMQMPAEESFWLLVATMDRYMNSYFTPNLSQLRIDCVIFAQLLKDHHPKLADHLAAHDVTPLMYMTRWYLTAFTMTLPWSSVLRVWDIFYFEGVSVYYRIGLAIMEICKDHLLKNCPTSTELLDFLLHIPHSHLEPDILFPVVDKIKLSKQELLKYTSRTRITDISLGDIPDVLENRTKSRRISSSSGSVKEGKRTTGSIGRSGGGMGSIGRNFLRRTGSSN